MGVLYHLRHPLLALDLIHDHVAGDLLVYQSMQRGSAAIEPVATTITSPTTRATTVNSVISRRVGAVFQIGRPSPTP